MTDETQYIYPDDPDVPRYAGTPVYDREPEDLRTQRDVVRRRNSIVLVAVAAVLCVLGGVVALKALTGGSGGDAGGGAGAGATADAGAAPPADLVTFVSPSGNIGCALSSAGARCDIAEKSWKPPAKPADCQAAWGVGVQVGAQAATVACASDSVLGSGQPLAYGASQERGSYRCSSSEEGMRCENATTGHGFTIARAAYTTF